MMYRATTPTLTFRMPKSVDMETATAIFVTFKKLDGTTLLTKDIDDVQVDDNLVVVHLTQAETLAFPLGVIKVMVNWMVDDERMATNPIEIEVKENFIEEVISNDE